MSRPRFLLVSLGLCALWLTGCAAPTSGGGGGGFVPSPCQNAIIDNTEGPVHNAENTTVKYTGIIVKDDYTGATIIRKVDILMGPYPIENPVAPLKYRIVMAPSAGGGLDEFTITVESGYIYVVESVSTATPTHCRPKIKTPRVNAVGEGTRYSLCNLIELGEGDPTRVYIWDSSVKLDATCPEASSTTGHPEWYHDSLSSASSPQTLLVTTEGRLDLNREPISNSRTYTKFQDNLKLQAEECGIQAP